MKFLFLKIVLISMCLALASFEARAQGSDNNIQPQDIGGISAENWNATPRIKFWYSIDEGGAANLLEEDILSAYDYVNELFEEVNVAFINTGVFEMANFQFDIIDNPINEDQMTTMYYTLGYINVYFVSDIAEFDGSESDGYVFLPPKSRDVIIIKKNGMNDYDKDLAHLLGHYFGLYNTDEIEFGLEAVDGSNCSEAGDLICDTYADPGGTVAVADNCNYTGPTIEGPGGLNYYPPVDNIMSNYPNACRCKFTPQQFDAMNMFRDSVRTNLW